MSIVNYYDHIKSDDAMRTYPNESKLNIKLPFRMLLLGPSGSGKTNVLLNLMKLIGVFDKIVLLAKDLEEPLYKHVINTYEKMEKKFKVKILLAISTVKDLPSVDDFNPTENSLLICDDLICEGKQDLAKVAAFWIRGRKKGISSVFLSQSYFCVPKLIRQNSGYVLIKKIDTPRDLSMLMKEYSLGVDAKQMNAMYQHALSTGDPHTSFFMIDTVTSKKSLRFRANFEPLMPD